MNYSSLLKNAISIVLISLVVLGGCKKETPEEQTPNNPEDIIGTWNLTAIKSVKGNETYHVPQEEIEADPLKYTYYENRTGLQFYQGTEIEYKWSADETKLTHFTDIIGYGLVIGSCTYTVNPATLTQTFPIDDHIITHTFNRE